MGYRVLIFVFVLIFCSVSKAQQCAPEPVFYIYLEGTTLSWEPSTNCNPTNYIVTIHSSNVGAVEYVYQSNVTSLDVSFLYFCRSYVFTISPVADNIIGPHSQLLSSIPLPDGASITITNFTGSQIDRNVLLEWSVPSEYVLCPQSYKVLLWNEDSDQPEEITTNESGYYITGVSQCMSYQVEISAKYQGVEQPISKFNYTVPEATNSPSLRYVRQDTITINTTWVLESYNTNRCNVIALHVNGERFNTSIPIIDSPTRPTVDVSITELRANSMYYFNVTVENSAGISRAYPLAVQTLPIESDSSLDFY